MARQIQVLYSYNGDDTQWEYIKPGIYDEGDSALFGLADKLLEKNIAQVYSGTKDEAPTFEKSAYAPRSKREGTIDITSGGG